LISAPGRADNCRSSLPIIGLDIPGGIAAARAIGEDRLRRFSEEVTGGRSQSKSCVFTRTEAELFAATPARYSPSAVVICETPGVPSAEDTRIEIIDGRVWDTAVFFQDRNIIKQSRQEKGL